MANWFYQGFAKGILLFVSIGAIVIGIDDLNFLIGMLGIILYGIIDKLPICQCDANHAKVEGVKK